MKKALIYVDGNQFEETIGLFDVVERIYKGQEVETVVLFLNQPGEVARGYGNRVIQGQVKGLYPHDARGISQCIARLHEQEGFDSILIPATSIGRMIAPCLAMKLHVGLVADVTDIHVQDEDIEMVRPAFDGKILAGITNQGRNPLMMSVRPGVFRYSGTPKHDTRFEEYVFEERKSRVARLLSSQEKVMSKDIRDSQVLVSGGGGIKEHFAEIEPLAKELHGMVAASRSVVDSGLASRTIQVGQSGKTVSPKLYIALGIYGSMQHFEGLRDVQYMIAVNKDKLAPLCSVADIVVEGDAYEFVQKMVEKIKQNNAEV